MCACVPVHCVRLTPNCAGNSTGWLLDGFPRTPAQATALQEAGCSPDSLLLIDMPRETLLEQATLRRFDPVTGSIYHLKDNPPVCMTASHR